MRRVSVVLALVIIFAGVLTGPYRVDGQEATPAPSDLPSAEAPFALGTVTLAKNHAEVLSLFARLPRTVHDAPRSQPPGESGGRVVASYGEPDPMLGAPLTLQAINFEEGDHFPRDFTAGLFVATAAGTADYGAETYGLDRAVAWVRAETTAGVAGDRPGTPEVIRPIHTLVWGDLDSHWIFTAAAGTPEGLEALVTAFVSATASAPSIPASRACLVNHELSQMTVDARTTIARTFAARFS